MSKSQFKKSDIKKAQIKASINRGRDLFHNPPTSIPKPRKVLSVGDSFEKQINKYYARF
jgi:hypothetical protein